MSFSALVACRCVRIEAAFQVPLLRLHNMRSIVFGFQVALVLLSFVHARFVVAVVFFF